MTSLRQFQWSVDVVLVDEYVEYIAHLVVLNWGLTDLPYPFNVVYRNFFRICIKVVPI